MYDKGYMNENKDVNISKKQELHKVKSSKSSVLHKEKKGRKPSMRCLVRDRKVSDLPSLCLRLQLRHIGVKFM
jgi:hypothetical protein